VWGTLDEAPAAAARLAPPAGGAHWTRLRPVVLSLLALVVLIAGAVQVVTLVNSWLMEGDDFAQYWAGARAVATGRSPYEWAQANQPLEVTDYNYPPLLALLLAPVTLVLDYPTARWAWLAFSALCVGIGVVVAWRTSGVRWREPSGIAALAFIGLLPATCIALEMGQLSPQLLLVIALSYGALGRHAGWAGALAAVATYLKSFPGLLLGNLLLRRQWRACIAAISAGLALVAASLAVLGWEAHWEYVTRVIPAQSRWLGGPFNVSLTGFFTRLFVDTPFTSPIVAAQGAGLALIALSTLLVLAATGYWAARARSSAEGERAAFALTVVAMMLVAPINGQYNLALALVPLAELVASVQRRWPHGLRWLLLVWLLLSLPVEFCDLGLFTHWCGPDLSNVPVKDLPWRQGWGNLLMSARFFGLVSLWALLIRLCLERSR